jgi:hypothetical protein
MIVKRVEPDPNRDGLRYSVIRDDVEIWSRFVAFGHDERHRAGGAAFVDAAREQDEIASRC